MSEKNFDVMWDDSPVDVTGEVNFIWSIANMLRGTYQPDKYKEVIIPMTIIRRFECALEPTKDKVVETFEKNPNYPVKAMCRISGFQFYNTSRYNLAELTSDPDHLAENFKSYLQGFSPNVQEIILSEEKGLDFGKQINKMDKNNRLLSVVKAFSELVLDPNTIDNIKMGYIFEDLIRRFSENAEAGDHYTGRDIIKLMVNILLAEGCDIYGQRRLITVLDQACGTGGMLSTAYNYIRRYNPDADVRLFGQEINPESYSMCLAEMLIKGQNVENIRYQDTLKADCFKDKKMRFVLENPPFGISWGGKNAAEGTEEAVKAEYAKGEGGRWGAGLPKSNDSQMLFLQSAVDKMDDENGRAAIIMNGSPLFNGETMSGESQVRRWLLENDLIEAIIQLSGSQFYNTAIVTYIMILSKNKNENRKGKVQLIDASAYCHKLRKALGEKKNEITPEDRAEITKIYAEFKEGEHCKIFDNEDFMFREITVMQPLQRNYCISNERIDEMIGKGALNSIYDPGKIAAIEAKEEPTKKELDTMNKLLSGKPLYDKIIAALRGTADTTVYKSETAFMPVLKNVLKGIQMPKGILNKISKGLSKMDKTAEIQRDKKNGDVLYDAETKDSEIIPLKESVEEYMVREVLPYVPDAVIVPEKDGMERIGAEIPFTRYFYRYEKPVPSEELMEKFLRLKASADEKAGRIFAS